MPYTSKGHLRRHSDIPLRYAVSDPEDPSPRPKPLKLIDYNSRQIPVSLLRSQPTNLILLRLTQAINIIKCIFHLLPQIISPMIKIISDLRSFYRPSITRRTRRLP